ncbi:hypothetical protein N9L68_05015 [bacterium]|nr:hypothetical protein [bacterium]
MCHKPWQKEPAIPIWAATENSSTGMRNVHLVGPHAAAVMHVLLITKLRVGLSAIKLQRRAGATENKSLQRTRS